MKITSTIFLTLLLSGFSLSGHTRQAAVKIISSRIVSDRDSIQIRFRAVSQNLRSNYELDLVPVLANRRYRHILSSATFVGKRRRKLLDRERILNHDSRPTDELFLVQNGDTLDYNIRLKNSPLFDDSHLHLVCLQRGCCGTARLADVYLPGSAQFPQPAAISPLPVTHHRPVLDEDFVHTQDTYVPASDKINYDRDTLFLYFRINKSDIDPYYLDNTLQLQRLRNAVSLFLSDPTLSITHITVVGSTSIEGSVLYNKKLGAKRASSLRSWLIGQGVPSDRIETLNLGENWASLRRQIVATPELPYRSQILDIIDNVPVNMGRKSRLMQIDGGKPYRWMLQNLFFAQRNAGCIRIYYQKR